MIESKPNYVWGFGGKWKGGKWKGGGGGEWKGGKWKGGWEELRFELEAVDGLGQHARGKYLKPRFTQGLGSVHRGVGISQQVGGLVR